MTIPPDQPPEWRPPRGDHVPTPPETLSSDFTFPDDWDDDEFPDEFWFGNDGDPLYYDDEEE